MTYRHTPSWPLTLHLQLILTERSFWFLKYDHAVEGDLIASARVYSVFKAPAPLSGTLATNT